MKMKERKLRVDSSVPKFLNHLVGERGRSWPHSLYSLSS